MSYLRVLQQRELRGQGPRRHRHHRGLAKALDRRFDGMQTVVDDLINTLDAHATRGAPVCVSAPVSLALRLRHRLRRPNARTDVAPASTEDLPSAPSSRGRRMALRLSRRAHIPYTLFSLA